MTLITWTELKKHAENTYFLNCAHASELISTIDASQSHFMHWAQFAWRYQKKEPKNGGTLDWLSNRLSKVAAVAQLWIRQSSIWFCFHFILDQLELRRVQANQFFSPSADQTQAVFFSVFFAIKTVSYVIEQEWKLFKKICHLWVCKQLKKMQTIIAS